MLIDSGKTKRKIQKYLCNDCKSSFTHFGKNVRKHSNDHLIRQAVLDFVLTKSSLQEVGNQYLLSKTIVLNWLSLISDRGIKI